MTNSFKYTALGFLISAFTSISALACPQNLKSLSDHHASQIDLCSIYDRYHAALTSMQSQGITTPEKVAGLYAPRFINYSTWQAKAEKYGYSPLYIYDPAPATWNNWSAGADWIQKSADKGLANSKINKISVDWLSSLHIVAMQGLLKNVGAFREGYDIGAALTHEKALTLAQIKNINSIEYPAMMIPGPIISWTGTECLEDKSKDFQDQYAASKVLYKAQDWPAKNVYFMSATGEQKQCGFIRYPHPTEMVKQINTWFKFINEAAENINSNDASIDPIMVAAKAQRWFITIHPFTDGNGRLSRYIMDYILKSLGLPVPILRDMDNDLYYTQDNWAKEIAAGLEYSTAFAESCAKDIHAAGCNVVASGTN